MGIDASFDLMGVRHVPHSIPSAPLQFKVYSQRVSTKHYTNILTCKKPKIFLQSGLNLLKFIINKVENCINILIPNSKKLFLAGAEMK